MSRRDVIIIVIKVMVHTMRATWLVLALAYPQGSSFLVGQHGRRRFLERVSNIRNRQLTLWSTVAEDDEGDDQDDMKARREREAKGEGENEETPFDVSLADSTFAGTGSPSDNGTRASESTAGNGALPISMNRYTAQVSQLSSTQIVRKFTDTAPARVQAAVKTTIAGLLGNMGQFTNNAATETSTETLASLMFQLQMTGYMFKNADYRLSLKQSLSGATERLSSGAGTKTLPPPAVGGGGGGVGSGSGALPTAAGTGALTGADSSVVGFTTPFSERPVSGNVSVTTPDGQVVAVDADAYVAELKGEVGKLRSELLALMERRDQREAALASDLIAYINTLPRSEMQTLTSGVQPEVLEAMETLVYGILKQFGVKEGDRIVLESSDAMKKLLLWQLAIGYNLRELEVRENFTKQFMESEAASDFSTGAIDNENPEPSPEPEDTPPAA